MVPLFRTKPNKCPRTSSPFSILGTISSYMTSSYPASDAASTACFFVCANLPVDNNLHPKGASSSVARSVENKRFEPSMETFANVFNKFESFPKYTKTSAATTRSNPDLSSLDLIFRVFSRVISSKSKTSRLSYNSSFLLSLPCPSPASSFNPHPLSVVHLAAISSILGDASIPTKRSETSGFRNLPASPVPQPASRTFL
mmetsp:Transcript_1758/g.2682  ORF Transcript_1758/g.2682 Transcript_1758/m.2682 type:complete len:200 (+) Transcript_1758:1032-1631(+)